EQGCRVTGFLGCWVTEQPSNQATISCGSRGTRDLLGNPTIRLPGLFRRSDVHRQGDGHRHPVSPFVRGIGADRIRGHVPEFPPPRERAAAPPRAISSHRWRSALRDYVKEVLVQWMPPDYSAHGWQVDRIIYITHWLMFVLFVFWSAYFLYVLYRYNAKRNPKASYHGMQSHWSTWSEAGVAVVEVVLLVGFSIPGWYQWSKRVEKESNPLEVRVIGEQFAWNIHY